MCRLHRDAEPCLVVSTSGSLRASSACENFVAETERSGPREPHVCLQWRSSCFKLDRANAMLVKSSHRHWSYTLRTSLLATCHLPPFVTPMWAKRCNWSPSGRTQLVEIICISVNSIPSLTINFRFSILINIMKRLWQGVASVARREVLLPIEIRADVV